MKKRVLVLSRSAWDEEELAKRKYRRDYDFVFFETEFYQSHPLLGGFAFNVLDSIERAITVGRKANVDGVIGTHDYPASLQAAAVSARLGLPGPPVDKALLCHHKYLCREMQRRAVPDAVPAFGLIDPFDFSQDALPLPFPFFVKPVKGTLSLRAALAPDFRTLKAILKFSPLEKRTALTVMRPFNQMLDAYTTFHTHGNSFIAEEVLPGNQQVTVEGFVEEGCVSVMGIVDSFMYPGTISFQRFEYPSRLPEAVQARMCTIATRIVDATGFHHGCFNVEMMYDARSDTVTVIEMNPRLCTQFSDLYEKVDGTSGYDVQLALATGRRVEFRRRQGRYSVAASFVPRTFQDEKVVRVPEPWRLAEIRRRFPGSVVRVLCHEGQWLSQQPQDMTSYRYGIVNLGGRSFEELDFAFDEARRLLKFQFASRNHSWTSCPDFAREPEQRPQAT